MKKLLTLFSTSIAKRVCDNCAHYTALGVALDCAMPPVRRGSEKKEERREERGLTQWFSTSLVGSTASLDCFFQFRFRIDSLLSSHALSTRLQLQRQLNSTPIHQQRKKPAASSAASLKPAKTEATKRKAAAMPASSTPSSSSLPARLELTCSVPAASPASPSSSETFVFVAEGSTRRFTVGRVKSGRSGLCLKDDQVSSKHAEVEWVPCEGEAGAGAEAAAGGKGVASTSSSGGRAARAARGRGETFPDSSSSPTAAGSSRRPQAAFGGAWVLHDMNSSNGTTINGLKAEPLEPYELKHSDEISFGGSSSCRVSLSVCAERQKTLTVEEYLAIEVAKGGDRCRADAERAAGELRARFRASKEQLYRDALEAWRAKKGNGKGSEVVDRARAAAAVQKLRSGPLDGGSGGVGVGVGVGAGRRSGDDKGKENASNA